MNAIDKAVKRIEKEASRSEDGYVYGLTHIACDSSRSESDRRTARLILMMDKAEWMAELGEYDTDDGGKGSGNWGHAGRPGEVGGSLPEGGKSGSQMVVGGGKHFRKYDVEKGKFVSKFTKEEREMLGALLQMRDIDKVVKAAREVDSTIDPVKLKEKMTELKESLNEHGVDLDNFGGFENHKPVKIGKSDKGGIDIDIPDEDVDKTIEKMEKEAEARAKKIEELKKRKEEIAKKKEEEAKAKAEEEKKKAEEEAKKAEEEKKKAEEEAKKKAEEEAKAKEEAEKAEAEAKKAEEEKNGVKEKAEEAKKKAKEKVAEAKEFKPDIQKDAEELKQMTEDKIKADALAREATDKKNAEKFANEQGVKEEIKETAQERANMRGLVKANKQDIVTGLSKALNDRAYEGLEDEHHLPTPQTDSSARPQTIYEKKGLPNPNTLEHFQEKLENRQAEIFKEDEDAYEICAEASEVLRQAFASDETSFGMRCDSVDIDRMFESRIMSQLELKKGKSHGLYFPSKRKAFSKEKFGTSEDTKGKSPYEVYGYLTFSDPNVMDDKLKGMDGAKFYGGAVLRFKKGRCAGRTTYTYGDSLDYSYNPGFIGADGRVTDMSNSEYAYKSGKTAINDAKSLIDSAKTKGKPLNAHDICKSTHNSYCELQYHGGFTIQDDVESISFPSKEEMMNCKHLQDIINCGIKIYYKNGSHYDVYSKSDK